MTKLSLLSVIAVAIVVLLWHKSDISKRKSSELLLITSLNWICYAPTKFNPRDSLFPTRESIQADLALLKQSGFDGVITYECSGPLADIADLAADIGLQVIQGIWGPANRKELERAIKKEPLVVAYCVGNEGLGTRYSFRELDQGIAYIANLTDRPVSISEQIHVYAQEPELVEMGDWIFPIVHPHFGEAKTVTSAVSWTREQTSHLRRLAQQRNQDKVLFFKEIGMPSSGDPAYSEEVQTEFLEHMFSEEQYKFAWFEAFDRSGWEYVSEVEPYWGIFRQDRSPKLAARRMQEALRGRKVPSTE